LSLSEAFSSRILWKLINKGSPLSSMAHLFRT
jgi:hypothetical protein